MGVLKSFSGDELLYDKEETVIILKFIFKPAHHTVIDELKIYDSIRNSIGARNASNLSILNISNRAEVHVINYDKNFPLPGVEKIWC